MTANVYDRLNGARSELAHKAPCRVATTTNITLSGTQTIDDVAVVAGDRVLVKDQTTASENGIYVVKATAWARARDCDGTGDLACGTLVLVHSGTTAYGIWQLQTADPITIGTTSQTWAKTFGGTMLSGNNLSDVSSASTSFNNISPTTTRGDMIVQDGSGDVRFPIGTAGYALISDGTDPAWTGFVQSGAGAVTRTWLSKARDIVSVTDFGATGDGVADDTAEIQAALDSGATVVHLAPGETYKISSTLTVPAGVWIEGNAATLTQSTHFQAIDFANGGGIRNTIMTGAGGGSYTSGSTAIGCSGTNNAPSAPTYVTGPTIEGCTISDYGEYGIALSYVRTGKIVGNSITEVGYAGVGGVSCDDVIVHGNIIGEITAGSAGGDAYGVFIDRNDGTSETEEPRSYRCIITNNLIKNISATAANNGQGIDTHGGVDFIIAGNKITDCEAGIFVTASSISGTQELAPQRCVVSNNIISGSYSSYGIILYGARDGSSVNEYASDCVVTGNVMVGYGSQSDSTIPGMLISATKQATVTGNIFKQCGGSGIMFDFQNIALNISGNTFIDPQSTSFAAAACIYVAGNDNRGYIGGNTFRYEDGTLATYVAVNAVRIASSLTGLDLEFGRSAFQGIDASHLAFQALTTTGVKYAGLYRDVGSGTITVTSGGSDGITDVTFSRRFPYAPTVKVNVRHPFNQGGVFPIVAVDTSVAISATGFRVYAKPVDGTTWSATGALDFDWVAE